MNVYLWLVVLCGPGRDRLIKESSSVYSATNEYPFISERDTSATALDMQMTNTARKAAQRIIAMLPKTAYGCRIRSRIGSFHFTVIRVTSDLSSLASAGVSVTLVAIPTL